MCLLRLLNLSLKLCEHPTIEGAFIAQYFETQVPHSATNIAIP